MQKPDENQLDNLIITTDSIEAPKLVITDSSRPEPTLKEKLKQLEEMYDNGVITRRQFLTIKTQLTGNVRRQSSYTKKRLTHEQRKARRKRQTDARRANRYKSQKGQKRSGRY